MIITTMKRGARLLLFPLLTFVVMAAFVTLFVSPAYSSLPPTCDSCDSGGGGETAVGGQSNVPFSSFTPSGSEDDAELGSACDSTEMEMDWTPNPDQGGDITSMTYSFQITDSYGNLVDEQTGDLADVGNPNGHIYVSSHFAIPPGGGASINIFINGQNASTTAGASFSGVQSPKC